LAQDFGAERVFANSFANSARVGLGSRHAASLITSKYTRQTRERAQPQAFAVGIERSGGCRALRRGEGLSDPQPREGEPDGGHRGAESLGGGAFLLRNGLLGFTM
jgi:hypothetical protein